MGENIQDAAAERGVLAGICNFGSDTYLDIADIVSAKTFTINSNQVIFACAAHSLKDRAISRLDYPTILSAANALGVGGFFENRDEAKHLRAVMTMSIEQESIRRLAARIRKLEIARELCGVTLGAASRIQAITGDEPVEEILGFAENPISEYITRISNGNLAGSSLMGEGAAAYYQYLIDNPREMMGISTGFPNFDRAIGGGLRAGCVDLIGARQKAGKTFISDNVGLHVVNMGVPVFNIDTEMSKEEHQIRVGACIAGVESEKIEQGKLNREDRDKLFKAAEKLATLPYHYECVIGVPFEDILCRMRRWILQKVGLADNGKAKPCLIIYDYLKLLDATGLKNNIAETQLLRFIASGLKNFMARYGSSCLTFAQLNREGIDIENASIIRGSDGILDAVTSFSLYKWKSSDERNGAVGDARKYTHKLKPLICRHGPCLDEDDYINIQTDYSRAKIIEGPTKFQLATNVARQEKGFVVSDDKNPINFAEQD